MAELLKFHGLVMTQNSIAYFMMDKNKNQSHFSCALDLSPNNDLLLGILFGAQQSLVTRKVNMNRITLQ